MWISLYHHNSKIPASLNNSSTFLKELLKDSTFLQSVLALNLLTHSDQTKSWRDSSPCWAKTGRSSIRSQIYVNAVPCYFAKPWAWTKEDLNKQWQTQPHARWLCCKAVARKAFEDLCWWPSLSHLSLCGKLEGASSVQLQIFPPSWPLYNLKPYHFSKIANLTASGKRLYIAFNATCTEQFFVLEGT